MDFISLIGHVWANRILTALAVLVVIGHVWSVVRLAIQQVKGRAPVGSVVDFFDVVAIVGPSLFGGVSRYLKASGREGLFAKPGEALKGAGGPPSGPSAPPLPALFFGLLLAVFMVGCPGVRSVLVDVTPTTPRRAPAACVADTQRCNGLVPEVCMNDEEGSSVFRWWPMHPLQENGTPAECAHRCVVESDVASCAAAE